MSEPTTEAKTSGTAAAGDDGLSAKPGKYLVVADSAEVRALASLKSTVVAHLPKGTKVNIENTESGRGMLTAPTFGWVSFWDESGNPILKESLGISTSSQMKKPSLAQLARILAENLDIKDRTYRFKTYKSCFIGSDAVTWMVHNRYARDRKHAVKLVTKLTRLGVVAHVVKEHNFKDDYLFFRINESKIPSKSSFEKSKSSSEAPEEETFEMLANELHILLSSKQEAIHAGKYTEAGHIQDHIEDLRARLKDMKVEISRKQSIDEVAPMMGSSNPGRDSKAKFSPTDFFSVSPEDDSKPVPKESQVEGQKLVRGARISVYHRGKLEASHGTLIRQKKGQPEKWYILYDDGRCELQNMTKVRFLVSFTESKQREGTGGSKDDDLFTKPESVAGVVRPDEEQLAIIRAERADTEEAVASVTSSLREFSIGERNLGKTPSEHARERSGRFSNNSTGWTAVSSVERRSSRYTPPVPRPEVEESVASGKIEATDSFLVGGMNSTADVPPLHFVKQNVFKTKSAVKNPIREEKARSSTTPPDSAALEQQLDRLEELQKVENSASTQKIKTAPTER
eukprot:CAMPEP_0114505700 /NCGR_PEP_ID=MMETSP0109-20121206/11000_1 /TAXON_ID=29199 /ORGANISM="Chlorarachnion reptans, Strain CCCM449" /LENGTH=569 /DNA_ID=CAMNT_0001684171 /DNA_START=139 /DNA_END=1848 /DNA_ORIENTATION=-